MSYFDSKALRAAKALAAKDWSHPKVLLAARHMAKEGKTTEEIRAALWPDDTYAVVHRRLKKLNIIPFNWANRARRGFETGVPGAGVDFRAYRPREVAK